MKCNKLIAIGYKPFKICANIDSIEIDFKSVLQIILGTNGSGKTKLLEIIPPLPVDTSLLENNAMIQHYYEHHERNYIITLKTDNAGKASYSFFDESANEELNPSGKVTIQKELVERVFGYTSNLHKILIGKISYSSMLPQQRKELLLQISQMDLTFVVNLFDKASKRLRDAKGAYKHVRAKVEQLGAEVVSDDVLNATLKRREQIINKITDIRSFIEGNNLYHVSNGIEDTLENINVILNNQDRYVQTLKRHMGAKGVDGLDNSVIDSLDKELSKLNDRLAIYTNKEKELSDKVYRINEIALKFEDVQGTSSIIEVCNHISEMEEKLSNLTDHIGELLSSVVNAKYAELCNDLVVDLMEVSASVTSTLKHYTVDEANDILFIKESMEVQLDTLKTKLGEKEKFLREILALQTQNVTCSKCGHENLASEHSSKECVETARAEVDSLNLEIDEKAKTYKEYIDKTYAPLYEFFTKLKAVNAVMDSYPSLKPIVAKILKSEYSNSLVLKNLSNIIAMLNMEVRNVEMTLRASEYERKINDLVQYKGLLEMGVLDTATSLENELSDVITVIGNVRKEQEVVSGILNELNRYNESETGLISNIETLKQQLVNSVAKELNEEAKREINKLSAELIVIDDVVFKARNKNVILELANKEQFELIRKVNALDAICTALSPKTGLIGDALRVVLESFSEDVNDYISQIWGYEMTVKPFSDKTDIDFKMPLVVKGSEVVDISEGSKGQREIIDFVVNLCIMDYLNLEDYMLFMDEVGSKFDTLHSENLIKFTQELAASEKYSNVFSVSHFSAQFSSQVNADYIVLNADNITVPFEVNQNVQIQ